jgi:hypothetical protein
MKRFLLAATLLAALAATLAAQTIRTPLGEFNLPGDWQPRPEWLAGVDAPGGHLFYDATSGGVLHLRPGDASWTEADIAAVVTQLREMEAGSESYPAVARVLSSAFFPLPAAYRERISGTRLGRRGYPRVWETSAEPGNAQWFYASQITTGLAARRVGEETYYAEEFAALRLVHGERRRAGTGEAVVFEIETVRPAVADAVARFDIAAARGRRVRYGWVLYAPRGLGNVEGMLSAGFAAPADAPLDAQAVLAALAGR